MIYRLCYNSKHPAPLFPPHHATGPTRQKPPVRISNYFGFQQTSCVIIADMPQGQYIRKHLVKRAIVMNDALGYALIPLTQGQWTIIDMIDVPYVEDFNWCARWNPATKSFYAIHDGHMLGTVIVQQWEPDAYCGDHLNHNTLDNRRSNLRPASRGENNQNCRVNKRNTSGYKGVTWYERHQLWCARIKVDGVRIHLGYFDTPELANDAYQVAKIKYHK